METCQDFTFASHFRCDNQSRIVIEGIRRDYEPKIGLQLEGERSPFTADAAGESSSAFVVCFVLFFFSSFSFSLAVSESQVSLDDPSRSDRGAWAPFPRIAGRRRNLGRRNSARRRSPPFIGPRRRPFSFWFRSVRDRSATFFRCHRFDRCSFMFFVAEK